MTDLNKERELCNQSFEKYWDDFCEAYGNGFDRSLAKLFFANAWGEAKAQAVPEGYVVVPKGVLDLTRFMCKTWAEIDNFVYKNCTNLGEYPVIQGTSNQFNLAKIGNQKVDNKAIPSAVKWFLESESGAEG
ncbi:hypothetical protein KG213_003607 [Acinetobacter baumannii]|uniref:hypothetical protein n=1 Tax=Acinetobacter baumannii TaxID=470 RepID=UPI002FECE751|nr:hypothetical protein [Acinetobacter baumannii]EKX3720108.1 hypothetical protein [Acinetobacter baumannii]EKX3750949.1 hypothetical protein [Acinetobacter baumannii]